MSWFGRLGLNRKKNNEQTKCADENEDIGSSFVIENRSLSGPFTYANLSIYLIHGTGRDDICDFVTLDEALADGRVVVKETGNVNELKIKNKSNEHVFVQAGDIVKGGKQDRTIKDDMILTPKSKSVAINAFCVESGRWSKRGFEDMTRFSSCDYYASKNLKMAARYRSCQADVWDEVTSTQTKTAESADVPLSAVTSDESPTSLHLTLENENVKDSISDYLENLSKIAEGKKDVLGVGFAVNGAINGIDVYPTNRLFNQMWSKLIKSAAVEAFSERNGSEDYSQPTHEQVEDFLDGVDKVKENQSRRSGYSKTLLKETDEHIMFETRDLSHGDIWVHKNYVSK